ncbi:CBASS cGAMP-activated phospholipase [Bacillus cereus]|uniref:CBASS cGAMP-activated phospholipase n=1 Tax=Bacillus cereus TaxID=1396 RepID=UPI001D0EB69E|nr:CBASS cGAMP-activated phospholipase [Bacillus cereus]MCC2382019.1 patatin-like phospholipase family protein [Bacillus cereus]
MDSSTYKILAIDGGGIKGLYSAVILEKFEEKFGPIHKHVDLICGTSTGGIIALALAAGIPAAKIVNLYAEKGLNIFPYQSSWRRKLNLFKQLIISSKYSDENLRDELSEVFGELKIKDCKSTVLIPSVNITEGTPFVFKSDHAEGLNRDSEHKLVDVALATSAAPTYFPIAEMPLLPKSQFVDGGLWANNPSLLGIQEAYSFYINKESQPFKRFSLLSIATLTENIKLAPDTKRNKGMLGWNQDLISLMMDTQSISVHNHINYVLRSLHDCCYIRIASEELNKEEKKFIELDYASPKSIEILKNKGKIAGDKWIENKDIENYFMSSKETVLI